VSDCGSGRIGIFERHRRGRDLLRPNSAGSKKSECEQTQPEDVQAHYGSVTQKKIGVSTVTSRSPSTFRASAC
jgi:hypothetical protein